MATKKTKPTQKKKPARTRATTGPKRNKASVAKKKAAVKKRPVAKKKTSKKTALEKPSKPGTRGKRERPLYSIRELAFQLGYAESTIRENINKNGGPVEEKTGRGRATKLDPAKWHRFFMDRQAGTSSPLLEARTRKTQAEADAKVLEHELRAGQVIEVESVAELFTEVMLLIGTSLDSISGKSAEGDAVLRAGFLKEVRNARARIHEKIKSYLARIMSGAGVSPPATGENIGGLGGK